LGGALSMKYREERPLANLDAAVKKLLEIANGMEADYRARRLQIGAINAQFLGAVPMARVSWHGTVVAALALGLANPANRRR